MRDEYGLTFKQRTFAELIAAGETNINAVYKAGFKPKSKRNGYVQAYQLTKHPNIRALVLESLERNRLGPDAVSHTLAKVFSSKDKDDIPLLRLKLDGAKELNKMLGAYAPTQHHALTARLDLTREDPRVLAWMAREKRRPTEEERASILEQK